MDAPKRVTKEAELKLAQTLQQRLRAFATQSTMEREASLPNIIGYIKAPGRVTPEVLARLSTPSSTNGDLRSAAEDALQSTFQIYTRVGGKRVVQEVNPWVGGYTIVRLDRDGTVRDVSTTPEGEVYKQYGANLSPYATAKAVQLLHLKLGGRIGTLSDHDNHTYLEDLLPKQTIFEGAAHSTHGFVGASGCGLKPEYVAQLLDIKPEGVSVNTLAGSGDMYFAKLVLSALNIGRPTSIAEPEFYAALRRAN